MATYLTVTQELEGSIPPMSANLWLKLNAKDLREIGSELMYESNTYTNHFRRVA